MGGGDCVRASEVIGAKRNSEEKAPEKKHPKKRRFPVALLSWYSTLESSVCELDANARRLKTREMAGAAASSEPPASETPRDATGERAEPRAVAADSLPATATTPPRSAPPRQSPRVFLAPVEDAPHSEHAVSFLLDHLAREGDVVHLLVVVPATHPSSALAYGGPMVPRVAQPPRSCAKPSLTCFAFFFSFFFVLFRRGTVGTFVFF